MDRVSKHDRSKIMAKIRSKNTKPEIILRSALHSQGIRFRVQTKGLPGTPDISIKKYKLIIDIRGCFWHGHGSCRDGHIPKTNTKFWFEKIQRNIKRDLLNENKIKEIGFKQFTIWECEIKKPQVLREIIEEIKDYLEWIKINK